MKLTQRQLGDHAGLYHTTISELERGVTLPSIGTLEKIAAALGVTAAFLLSGDHGSTASDTYRAYHKVK